MFRSTWLQLVRKLTSKPGTVSAKRPQPRCRPFVEVLEDRLAPATFTVTTIADSGAGSLRQAITSANAAAGADTITINLGAGLHTINLLSGLPAITGPVAMELR